MSRISADRLCIQSGSRRHSAIEVDKNLVPGDVKATERVLKHFGFDHDGAGSQARPKDNRMCIPKGAPDFEAWLANQADMALLREVYDVVCEGKELGASGRRLRGVSTDIGRVSAAVLKLMDAYHVIKAGVATTTFIGRPFASPWLLHSFRMSRVRMREGNAGLRQESAGCLVSFYVCNICVAFKSRISGGYLQKPLPLLLPRWIRSRARFCIRIRGDSGWHQSRKPTPQPPPPPPLDLAKSIGVKWKSWTFCCDRG